MRKIRVVVVDDSASMRQLLTKILSQQENIEVAASAPDAYRAWQAIQIYRPDVITLDIEMPKMNGLTFLARLMRARPTPVVMVSALTKQGSEATLKALELGAVDFVAKPTKDMKRNVRALANELVDKVVAAASAKMRRAEYRAASDPEETNTHKIGFAVDVFAIGSSTGGTEAIAELFSSLPRAVPPIVVVQHMPPYFTAAFAARLSRSCKINVCEARDGDELTRGTAFIAPGGPCHMEIATVAGTKRIRLVSEPPVNRHCPSVDVLFHSCARVFRNRAVGVLLTGMGADGAQGLLAMRETGARTIAQDEGTSVVYGMPRAAVECGAAEFVLPIGEMASALMKIGAGATLSKRQIG